MRRIKRVILFAEAARYLRNKQMEIDSAPTVNAERMWDNARRTIEKKGVLRRLQHMAGKSCRCMYCSDSAGTDIDHFRPKAAYPDYNFIWENMLLACAACNRKKGDQLELDVNGIPLLIDPTLVNPWDHLYYDSVTGILAPRFVEGVGYDRMGEYTTSTTVLPINVQHVIEGRKAEQRRLLRAIADFRQGYAAASSGKARNAAIKDFLRKIQLLDRYDLGYWYFCDAGQNEIPFAQFARDFPSVFSAAATFYSCTT